MDFGCNFSWQIDDVLVTEIVNDVAIFEPLDVPDHIVPLTQVSTLDFGVKIDNRGGETIQNPTFNVTVSRNDTIEYETTVSLNGNLPGNTVTNGTVVIDGSFTPESIGFHQIKYELQYEDDNPTNNTVYRNFIVTENVMGKDDATPAVNATGVDNTNPFQIGSFYFIPNGGTFCTDAIFSIATNDNSHIGTTVNLFLYQLAPDDNTNVFNDNDVIIVGTGSYTFGQDDISFDLFAAPMISMNTEEQGVALEANTGYFLMIEYQPGTFIPFTTNPYFDLIGTSLRTADGWFPGGFSDRYLTVIARMVVRTEAALSVDEIQLDDDKFALYPNPADEYVHVNFNLDNINRNVVLYLTGLDGKMLGSRVFSESKRESFDWNVSNLPSGQYLLKIRTEEGVATRKVVVQH